MLEQAALPRVNVILSYDASAVALPQGELFVGRSAACFLSIDDPAVSRHHLRFVIEAGRAVVEDLCSTNGTLLNGRPLRGTHPLADGDQVKLGSRVLRVRFVDTAAASAAERGTPTPEATSTVLRRADSVELSESCPQCRAAVGLGAKRCASCGFHWPQGSPRARTAPEHPATTVRRRAERVDVQLGVRYVSETLRTDGRAMNISRNGVFVAAARLDPVGTHCALQFSAQDGGAVLHGFVRRAIHRAADGRTGMGIEFSAMSEDAQGWLLGRLAQIAIRSLD